jgi:serine protease AprX
MKERVLALLIFSLLPGSALVAPATAQTRPMVRGYKLDDQVLRLKAANPRGMSSVIATTVAGTPLPARFAQFARSGGRLRLIDGHVLDLPNAVLAELEAHPDIFRVHNNRPVGRFNYRTSFTVGAIEAQTALGYTGAGIGVAVIDSGITAWHDDLTTGGVATTYPYGDQRVRMFVDFVGGGTQPYDDNGHGTHVAGIVAGNGYNSRGEKAGIAPNASLIALKVLDEQGQGTISGLIAALDWVADNHAAHDIRVVNLSIGAPVFESYWTDPLTLAVKALVDRGIVVVAASGNFGENDADELQLGGITAPGNAPWVLTVGASSTQGTFTRADDIVADYSSSGPTYIDFSAKPDLVAPGTGTVSLAAAGSHFATSKPEFLIDGSPAIGYKPYLALTGSSMAAPVVSGTVALMLEANPSLTPNLVKAILQYTAQPYPEYEPLRQGAGFLNTLGSVQLAEFYARNAVGALMPAQDIWSRSIIWGNYLVADGYLNPRANAWDPRVVWGADHGLDGDDPIVWGTTCGRRCGNVVWGTEDASGENVLWASGRGNVVWGTGRGNVVWGTGRGNVVWGTGRGNVVWGTGRGNVVWGTGRGNVVWGTSDEGGALWGLVRRDNVVWGTGGRGNVVWGTDCGGQDCDSVLWGIADGDGYVWGSGRGNVVWGTGRGNVVWGTGRGNVVWGTGRGNVVWGTGRGNVVWGTGRGNVVWGTGRGNVVWGTSEGDVTWGSSPDAVIFADEGEPLPDVAVEFGESEGR